ncbi:hypothetical protein [Tropicibacter sp. Alg240-R139]|nr:hypothetical protein [Tropicibacter sp. Alg240-R139]
MHDRNLAAAQAAVRSHIEAGHRQRPRLLRAVRRVVPQPEEVLADPFRD